MPELPAVTDPTLLECYWDNSSTTKIKPEGNSQRRKRRAWQNLELLGDGYLLYRSRFELGEIFGRNNYQLLRSLEEHAKGNALLIQIAMSYQLDKLVRVPPAMAISKDWADLAEAWIGAIVQERLLMNESFDDLDFWLARIWRVRYRNLREYSTGLEIYCRHQKPGGEIVRILDERKVGIPGDELLETVIRRFSTARKVGYQVTAQVKINPSQLLNVRLPIHLGIHHNIVILNHLQVEN